MRFAKVMTPAGRALCVLDQHGTLTGLFENDARYPGELIDMIRAGGDALERGGAALAQGEGFDADAVTWLPPIETAEKIICVGLNYVDHATESGFEKPAYPALFSRYNSSLIGHEAVVPKPTVSDALDYEAEMVAVIGLGGRAIPKERALDHVVGYSVFNDVSVRDFQMKSTQWMIGKNFDATGVFGPTFVTADEVPAGGKGLRIEARLNGEVVQSATTTDMIFDVAELVAMISTAMTLAPGDIIVTGTPSGVGMARTPPLWMKDGDVVEIEIERLGLLRNRIVAEA